VLERYVDVRLTPFVDDTLSKVSPDLDQVDESRNGGNCDVIRGVSAPTGPENRPNFRHLAQVGHQLAPDERPSFRLLLLDVLYGCRPGRQEGPKLLGRNLLESASGDEHGERALIQVAGRGLQHPIEPSGWNSALASPQPAEKGVSRRNDVAVAHQGRVELLRRQGELLIEGSQQVSRLSALLRGIPPSVSANARSMLATITAPSAKSRFTLGLSRVASSPRHPIPDAA